MAQIAGEWGMSTNKSSANKLIHILVDYAFLNSAVYFSNPNTKITKWSWRKLHDAIYCVLRPDFFKVFATLEMAPPADVMTSRDARVGRKVVLTRAAGVVTGTAIASITGAEWSNPKYTTQTAFFAFIKRIVYAL